MNKKIYFASAGILAIFLMSAMVAAQPPQGRREMPAERRTAVSSEQAARMKTDMLAKELGLTEKQDNKVYKLYLRQAKQLSGDSDRPVSENMAPGGMGMSGGGPQGGMGGGRGMHGGPPLGSGGRGGMGPGGGNMGPQEGHHGMQHGSAPTVSPRQEGAPQPFESKKEVAKRDKKMKKILSAGQYEKWERWEQQDRHQHMRRMWNEEMMNGAAQ